MFHTILLSIINFPRLLVTMMINHNQSLAIYIQKYLVHGLSLYPLRIGWGHLWIFLALKWFFVNKLTYFNFSGYYAFIETSVPRKSNDTAVLHSLKRWPKNGGECFSFWYHMYGYAIGTLNLHIETKTMTKIVWQLKGNQGMKWLNGRIPLDISGEEYQVSIMTVLA